MAIYRLEVKAISRGQGRSVVAAAAYRHAMKLQDERQQLTHSYDQKDDVLHSEIIAPADAPDWAYDRQQLWNHVDAAEKRRDAMTAREILLSLPRELGREQQIELVRNFVQDNFTSRGLVADVAIHEPSALDGNRQPHAHVMSSDRPLDQDGFASKKDRTLNQPENIDALRKSWANHVNTAMERENLEERVDHRSLVKQRQTMLMVVADNTKSPQMREEAGLLAKALDRQPEPKIGPVALQMAKTGRAEQAHAYQDAMQARQERSLIEKAWIGIQTVRTEAYALAERFKGLFQNKPASTEPRNPSNVHPNKDASSKPATANERIVSQESIAELKREYDRTRFAFNNAMALEGRLRAEVEWAREVPQKKLSDRIRDKLNPSRIAEREAAKHQILTDYNAAKEHMEATFEAYMTASKPYEAAREHQRETQLQADARRMAADIARTEREKQEKSVQMVDPIDRAILKPQTQTLSTEIKAGSNPKETPKQPEKQLEAKGEKQGEQSKEAKKPVEQSRPHKQRM